MAIACHSPEVTLIRPKQGADVRPSHLMAAWIDPGAQVAARNDGEVGKY